MGARPLWSHATLKGWERVVRRKAAVFQSHARARRQPCFVLQLALPRKSILTIK